VGSTRSWREARPKPNGARDLLSRQSVTQPQHAAEDKSDSLSSVAARIVLGGEGR
jgi:hypothetical protein